MKREYSYVYLLTVRETDEFYVGSSSNLKKRLETHFHQLKTGKHHNLNLQSRWNSGNHVDVGYYACRTRDEAYKLEQNIIDDHRDSSLLLNIGLGVRGGDNLSNNPKRASIIEKIKTRLGERYQSLTDEERKRTWGRKGESNPMYGKTHSVEAREKISKANVGHSRGRGRKLPEWQRTLLSEKAKLRTGDKNPFHGKSHNEETKRKLSQASLGRKPVNTNRIEIDGIVYASQADAAKALKVAGGTITFRLKSKNPKYSSYRVVHG